MNMGNSKTKYEVPLIIPTYEPNDDFIIFIDEIKIKYHDMVIIINDGSSDYYNYYFDYAEKNGFIVLKNNKNCGKGYSLKKAFKYLLDYDIKGSVTADSDGQHKIGDINKIRDELISNSDSLILGVREFDSDKIPAKSKFGNELTRKFFKFLFNVDIKDTQTGLRGIPKSFLDYLIDVTGDRFEFEMVMLILAIGRYRIKEIAIETIYDSKENHKTHFNPIIDSIKIYLAIFRLFLKYRIRRNHI